MGHLELQKHYQVRVVTNSEQVLVSNYTHFYNNMSASTITTSSAEPIKKAILTINLSLHLHSKPVSSVLTNLWSSIPPTTTSRFSNSGYNLDPTDVPATIRGLRKILQSQKWDGILIGWCVRGNKEWTELFERVVQVTFEEKRGRG